MTEPSPVSDGDTCFKVGYTKKPAYRWPFTSAARASLAGNRGSPFPQKKMKLGLAEKNFPAVLRG